MQHLNSWKSFQLMLLLKCVMSSLHTYFKFVHNSLQWFWFQIFFFVRGNFCSIESAKFEKNLQKVYAFFFESKETTPFSFNDILDCLSPLEFITRDFKAWLLWDYSHFLQYFLKVKFFLIINNFLSEHFAYLKLVLSISFLIVWIFYSAYQGIRRHFRHQYQTKVWY